MTDFRIFRGTHQIALKPGIKYGHVRPIVLFGGLNGAGKTSILLAIRLAFHGRQSLGRTTSHKAYSEFLLKSIHKTQDSIVPAGGSSVEVTFEYAHLGEISEYQVTRSWERKGAGVFEDLVVSKDGKEIGGLDQDQAQAFLNELVPLGVSELFFFDGEKVSDLAAKSSNLELANSIQKLIGLDIINVLSADLALYKRKRRLTTAPDDLAKQQTVLEKELSQYRKSAHSEQTEIDNCRCYLAELEVNIQRAEAALLEMGGAWARSRQKSSIDSVDAKNKIEHLEQNARELLSSRLPLALALGPLKSLLKGLEDEELSYSKDLQRKGAMQLAEDLISEVELEKFPGSTTFLKYLRKKQHSLQGVQYVSDKEFNVGLSVRNQIQKDLEYCISEQHLAIDTLAKLEQFRDKLQLLEDNFARAPEDELLREALAKLSGLQTKKAEQFGKIEKHFEKRKSLLRSALTTVKKLEDITEQIDSRGKVDRKIKYAATTQSLLKEFSKKMTKYKVGYLKEIFEDSYQALARKEDLHLTARIDPLSFDIKLIDAENATEVSIDDMSAGERQIYAIAMLNSLAKASGRNLPVVIDTPLGRLDSKHREKLAKYYFPIASHQVILLSTDTEIDKSFFSKLSPNISHAFEVIYSPEKKSSFVRQGYFWRQAGIA